VIDDTARGARRDRSHLPCILMLSAVPGVARKVSSPGLL